MEPLSVAVLGVIAVCASTSLGTRLRVAPPLLLVALGIGVSLLPFVPVVEVEPEWILAGLLPPLLYSAAVSMPSMEFRREFGSIGGLSVLLVVVSSLLLGLVFWWLVPGLDLGPAIALGAIVTPTDAVATSIVKATGVSSRITAILEGEGLLNDATALVVLRTAIAATATGLSFWGALGDFAYAVAVAVVIGVLVGNLNLLVRARVTSPAVNTALSFTVPFLASIPAEHLEASGLVAAVVAGLVTGYLAPRRLSPSHRLSDSQNWRTVELLLEGAIFLIMGLELSGLLEELASDEVRLAVLVGLAATVACVLVRAAFTAPLLALLARHARRNATKRDRFAALEAEVADDGVGAMQRHFAEHQRTRSREVPEERLERMAKRFGTRLRRAIADVDYFVASPLSWRDGAVVIWAGMRGAITLAAAQTLPDGLAQRELLVTIAFFVALFSLVLQGGSLRWFVRVVEPSRPPGEAELAEVRGEIIALLRAAAEAVGEGNDGRPRIAVIEAQRSALLDARDDGLYDAAVLTGALEALDAEQISLELRGG